MMDADSSGGLNREQSARRAWLIAWSTILACGSSLLSMTNVAHAAPPALPEVANLAADCALAKERRVPMLLFFNRVGCPYCERALREFLRPMANDPANAPRVLFRQVETNKPVKMVDFKGDATTHRKFAAQYKIKLTPTIWFVDGDGNGLAEPIVGLTTPDYYGYYLDKAIEESLAKIRTGA